MTQKALNGNRLLTLTTDFGTAAGYVGAIKGRVISAAPEAKIIDITHEIAPYNLLEGAWCLRRAAPQFPPGTIHMAVVDPGVGGARAGLIVQTERFLLLAPDNGLLSLIAREEVIRRIVAVREAPPEIRRSGSFDGLTFFAPVAAKLLLGAAPEDLGDPADGMIELPQREPVRKEGMLEGEILFFDRFGNAITNITREHLEGRQAVRVKLQSGRQAVISGHYQQVAGSPETIAAIWNSDGHLELALFGSSLREQGIVRAGESVLVILEN